MPHESTLISPKPPRDLSSSAIALIVCGNFLEWYDFAVYGYLSLRSDGCFSPPRIASPKFPDWTSAWMTYERQWTPPEWTGQR